MSYQVGGALQIFRGGRREHAFVEFEQRVGSKLYARTKIGLLHCEIADGAAQRTGLRGKVAARYDLAGNLP